jgi:hypothetical protein
MFRVRHHPLLAGKHIGMLLALGVLTLPLFLCSIPALELGRTEARTMQAFIEAQRLQKGKTEASELDSWGQPYQIVTNPDDPSHIVRVFSFGPDAISRTAGHDADDIASDMTTRPRKRFEDSRLRQWLIAFAVWGTAWILSDWLYLSSVARKNLGRGDAANGV